MHLLESLAIYIFLSCGLYIDGSVQDCSNYSALAMICCSLALSHRYNIEKKKKNIFIG